MEKNVEKGQTSGCTSAEKMIIKLRLVLCRNLSEEKKEMKMRREN